MVVLSKEIQAFIGSCEHLLSTTPSSPLSDDERRIVGYYIQELSNKYGAPTKVTPVRRSHLTLVTKASPGCPSSLDIPLPRPASDGNTEQP
jgi:hypothetical protein